MTTLYHIENSQSNQKLQDMLNYISSAALEQEIHLVENHLFNELLVLGKLLLEKFIEIKGIGKNLVPKEKNLLVHSIKKRNYLSIFGDITIARAYFWQSGSHGIFPLDAELNLPKHHHSYLLEKWIQGRVAEGPYEDAIKDIGNLLNLKITKRVTQQITSESSQEIDNYYKQKTNFIGEGPYLVAQVDCKGVIMIPKERPETKLQDEFIRRSKGVSKIGIRRDAVVTTDYSINLTSRTPSDVLEGLMCINSNRKDEKKLKKVKKRNQPINKQVCGTMFGKEKAFSDLADRIYARDVESKKPVYLLIDGAASLEKGFIKEFKKRGWESRIEGCCLDIVHASEYLWDASTAIYGEISPKRASWVKTNLLKLLQGKVRIVNKELSEMISSNKFSKFTKRRLQRTLTYFENHAHMMSYKKYLKKGFPIASGAIEGACNTLVKDRTDRSGMQWTKSGSNAVIGLRSAQCNNDWEDYWDYNIQKQREKLYGEHENLAA